MSFAKAARSILLLHASNFISSFHTAWVTTGGYRTAIFMPASLQSADITQAKPPARNLSRDLTPRALPDKGRGLSFVRQEPKQARAGRVQCSLDQWQERVYGRSELNQEARSEDYDSSHDSGHAGKQHGVDNDSDHWRCPFLSRATLTPYLGAKVASRREKTVFFAAWPPRNT
jgi:hypothetical protein